MGLRETRKLVAQWPIRRRGAALYREFAREGSKSALRHLLTFIQNNSLPLDVSRSDVRERLFDVDWTSNSDPIEPGDRDLVFRALDQFLLDATSPKSTGEWRSWIRMSRVVGRNLPVTEPRFAHGLLRAKRKGALVGISNEDSTYLLSCYLHCYGEILQGADVGDRRLVLPILLEFSAIAQTLGPTDYSSATLQRWTQNVRKKPRAVASFTDEQAWNAPIRGIGSPNGISLTTYRDGKRVTPTRIAYAGMTADRTLNTQVFAGLFSAALASDCSRSFLTQVGGLLQLEAGEFQVDPESRHVLRASLTVGGRPIEPEGGIAPIGMSPSEAFQLVDELFQRFKACTGLVSVIHWGVEDADALEQRIHSALTTNAEGPRLRSNPAHSEGNSVIHVMPLLHRNKSGIIEPVRIPIPYSILNPGLTMKLTRSARQSYMAQLIANCRRREAMAADAFKEQKKLVKAWEELKPEQKDSRCKAHPTIQITQRYDFELGIVVRVDPPESMSLAEYENVRRPKLRDSAKEFTEKFKAMCNTLESLNRSDGPADQLTFKFLVDAAVRQDPVLIADEEFQRDYRTWIDHSTAPVWALVEDWAMRSGYPIEMMAADNMLFNSELKEDEQTVWILPHVMIDLHDFEVLIDNPNGMMFALPAGHSSSIREKIIASPDRGITDPATLRGKFREWVDTRLQTLSARPRSEEDLRRQILSDKRFSGLVYLKQGKRMLMKREWERSIAAFARARPSDLAPVYFWGAVAYQCRFLSQNRMEPATAANMGDSDRLSLLIEKALQLLMDSSSTPVSRAVSPSLWTRPLEVGIRRPDKLLESAQATPSIAAIDREAKAYWNQLLARDPRFVQGLSRPNSRIYQLEAASLKVTPAEEQRLSAAMHALMALDFLALAERMKTAARSLPFSGLPMRDLRTEIEEVLKSARTMPVEDPPGTAQIEELGGLLNCVRFV